MTYLHQCPQAAHLLGLSHGEVRDTTSCQFAILPSRQFQRMILTRPMSSNLGAFPRAPPPLLMLTNISPAWLMQIKS